MEFWSGSFPLTLLQLNPCCAELLFNRVISRKWLLTQVVQRHCLIIFFLELEKVKNAAKTLTGIGKISQNVFSLFQSLRLLAEIKYCQVEKRGCLCRRLLVNTRCFTKNNYQTYHLVVLMASSLMYRNVWWNGWAHPLSPTLTSSVQQKEIFPK